MSGEDKDKDKDKLYCWIRVIPATLAGLPYEPLDGHVSILNGPKRPKRSTVTGASGAEAFGADEVHYGDPKSELVFDHGPAFAKHANATEWLATKGQLWASQAVNFMLQVVETKKT